MAARLGEAFQTDPIRMLDVSETDWLIRLACAEVLRRDAEKREKDRAK